MYPGLPTANLALALVSSHSMRVKVTLLDLEMRPIGSDLSGSLLDGSVNVNDDAEVTRAATLTLLDPSRSLSFDSNSPAVGAVYADRMVRITYGVRLAGSPGAKWIDVPVFTGPVTKFTRNGTRVSIEAQGKEVLSQGASFKVITIPKSTLKTDAILTVMRSTGERTFDFADSNAKMPKASSLVHETIPWDYAQSVARSMGMQLFYDGGGRLVLRDHPGRSIFTFRSGTSGSILTRPSVEFSTDGVKNAVRVTGQAPKGKKKKGQPEPKNPPPPRKIIGSAVAPASHPLSPNRLGRNSSPRYLAEFIDDPKVGTNAEADKVAKARLAVLLAQIVTVNFDSVAVPHLDVGDFVTVTTDEFTMQQRLRQFTIPLTAAGTMSVGYMSRQTKPRRTTAKRKKK